MYRMLRDGVQRHQVGEELGGVPVRSANARCRCHSRCRCAASGRCRSAAARRCRCVPPRRSSRPASASARSARGCSGGRTPPGVRNRCSSGSRTSEVTVTMPVDVVAVGVDLAPLGLCPDPHVRHAEADHGERDQRQDVRKQELMPRPLVSTTSSGTRSASASVVHREEHRGPAPAAALVVAAAEHPCLGEAEVPQRRSLGREDRRQRRSRCPITSANNARSSVFTTSPVAPDDREAPEPGGELAELQAAELAQVPQRLAHRGLRVDRRFARRTRTGPRTRAGRES